MPLGRHVLLKALLQQIIQRSGRVDHASAWSHTAIPRLAAFGAFTERYGLANAHVQQTRQAHKSSDGWHLSEGLQQQAAMLTTQLRRAGSLQQLQRVLSSKSGTLNEVHIAAAALRTAELHARSTAGSSSSFSNISSTSASPPAAVHAAAEAPRRESPGGVEKEQQKTACAPAHAVMQLLCGELLGGCLEGMRLHQVTALLSSWTAVNFTPGKEVFGAIQHHLLAEGGVEVRTAEPAAVVQLAAAAAAARMGSPEVWQLLAEAVVDPGDGSSPSALVNMMSTLSKSSAASGIDSSSSSKRRSGVGRSGDGVAVASAAAEAAAGENGLATAWAILLDHAVAAAANFSLRDAAVALYAQQTAVGLCSPWDGRLAAALERSPAVLEAGASSSGSEGAGEDGARSATLLAWAAARGGRGTGSALFAPLRRELVAGAAAMAPADLATAAEALALAAATPEAVVAAAGPEAAAAAPEAAGGAARGGDCGRAGDPRVLEKEVAALAAACEQRLELFHGGDLLRLLHAMSLMSGGSMQRTQRPGSNSGGRLGDSGSSNGGQDGSSSGGGWLVDSSSGGSGVGDGGLLRVGQVWLPLWPELGERLARVVRHMSDEQALQVLRDWPAPRAAAQETPERLAIDAADALAYIKNAAAAVPRTPLAAPAVAVPPAPEPLLRALSRRLEAAVQHGRLPPRDTAEAVTLLAAHRAAHGGARGAALSAGLEKAAAGAAIRQVKHLAPCDLAALVSALAPGSGQQQRRLQDAALPRLLQDWGRLEVEERRALAAALAATGHADAPLLMRLAGVAPGARGSGNASCGDRGGGAGRENSTLVRALLESDSLQQLASRVRRHQPLMGPRELEAAVAAAARLVAQEGLASSGAAGSGGSGGGLRRQAQAQRRWEDVAALSGGGADPALPAGWLRHGDISPSDFCSPDEPAWPSYTQGATPHHTNRQQQQRLQQHSRPGQQQQHRSEWLHPRQGHAPGPSSPSPAPVSSSRHSSSSPSAASPSAAADAQETFTAFWEDLGPPLGHHAHSLGARGLTAAASAMAAAPHAAHGQVAAAVCAAAAKALEEEAAAAAAATAAEHRAAAAAGPREELVAAVVVDGLNVAYRRKDSSSSSASSSLLHQEQEAVGVPSLLGQAAAVAEASAALGLQQRDLWQHLQSAVQQVAELLPITSDAPPAAAASFQDNGEPWGYASGSSSGASASPAATAVPAAAEATEALATAAGATAAAPAAASPAVEAAAVLLRATAAFAQGAPPAVAGAALPSMAATLWRLQGGWGTLQAQQVTRSSAPLGTAASAGTFHPRGPLDEHREAPLAAATRVDRVYLQDALASAAAALSCTAAPVPGTLLAWLSQAAARQLLPAGPPGGARSDQLPAVRLAGSLARLGCCPPELVARVCDVALRQAGAWKLPELASASCTLARHLDQRYQQQQQLALGSSSRGSSSGGDGWGDGEVASSWGVCGGSSSISKDGGGHHSVQFAGPRSDHVVLALAGLAQRVLQLLGASNDGNGGSSGSHGNRLQQQQNHQHQYHHHQQRQQRWLTEDQSLPLNHTDEQEQQQHHHHHHHQQQQQQQQHQQHSRQGPKHQKSSSKGGGRVWSHGGVSGSPLGGGTAQPPFSGSLSESLLGLGEAFAVAARCQWEQPEGVNNDSPALQLTQAQNPPPSATTTEAAAALDGSSSLPVLFAAAAGAALSTLPPRRLLRAASPAASCRAAALAARPPWEVRLAPAARQQLAAAAAGAAQQRLHLMLAGQVVALSEGLAGAGARGGSRRLFSELEELVRSAAAAGGGGSSGEGLWGTSGSGGGSCGGFAAVLPRGGELLLDVLADGWQESRRGAATAAGFRQGVSASAAGVGGLVAPSPSVVAALAAALAQHERQAASVPLGQQRAVQREHPLWHWLRELAVNSLQDSSCQTASSSSSGVNSSSSSNSSSGVNSSSSSSTSTSSGSGGFNCSASSSGVITISSVSSTWSRSDVLLLLWACAAAPPGAAGAALWGAAAHHAAQKLPWQLLSGWELSRVAWAAAKGGVGPGGLPLEQQQQLMEHVRCALPRVLGMHGSSGGSGGQGEGDRVGEAGGCVAEGSWGDGVGAPEMRSAACGGIGPPEALVTLWSLAQCCPGGPLQTGKRSGSVVHGLGAVSSGGKGWGGGGGEQDAGKQQQGQQQEHGQQQQQQPEHEQQQGRQQEHGQQQQQQEKQRHLALELARVVLGSADQLSTADLAALTWALAQLTPPRAIGRTACNHHNNQAPLQSSQQQQHPQQQHQQQQHHQQQEAPLPCEDPSAAAVLQMLSDALQSRWGDFGRDQLALLAQSAPRLGLWQPGLWSQLAHGMAAHAPCLEAQALVECAAAFAGAARCFNAEDGGSNGSGSGGGSGGSGNRSSQNPHLTGSSGGDGGGTSNDSSSGGSSSSRRPRGLGSAAPEVQVAPAAAGRAVRQLYRSLGKAALYRLPGMDAVQVAALTQGFASAGQRHDALADAVAAAMLGDICGGGGGGGGGCGAAAAAAGGSRLAEGWAQMGAARLSMVVRQLEPMGVGAEYQARLRSAVQQQERQQP